MYKVPKLDKKVALSLANCCSLTYRQYHNNGEFSIPEGYKLVQSFKANSLGISEWFGFIIVSQNSIVLAFRGTQSAPDWISDIEASQVEYPYVKGSGKTHRGFTDIYSSCRNQVINALKELPQNLSLHITGHSLGAALAVLSTLDVAVNTQFKNPISYNFAGPRAGNPDFASYYNKLISNSIRVVNIHDTVPMVPPPIMYSPVTKGVYQYRHVQGAFPINIHGGSIAGNHSIDSYIHGLKYLSE